MKWASPFNQTHLFAAEMAPSFTQVVTELQAPLLTRSSVRTMTGALGGNQLSFRCAVLASCLAMSEDGF